jgi:hypothetical protein
MFQFTIALIAAVSAGAAEGGDKPFYFRSFEHAAPSVNHYRISGSYGTNNDPFALSLDFRKGQWDVEVKQRGSAPLKLRLDKVYNSIPINRILVAAEGDGRDLLVLIPFGTPRSECFANGSDVYDLVVIEKNGEITLEHFPKCDLEIINLPVERSAETLEVGAPPQSVDQ